MSIRARLTILVALCVAGAVIAVSLVAYFVTQSRLVRAVDDTLQGRAQFVSDRSFSGRGPGGGSSPNGAGKPGLPSIDIFQVIDDRGKVVDAPADQEVALPVGSVDIAVAARTHPPFFHNVRTGDDEYRVYTAPGRNGQAVLVARSLDEVNTTLADLRNILIVVSASGIGVAALLGLFVAHRALRPVARLTAAAEHVAATQDLSHSIDVSQRDEIGRLAASFNTMLSELHASREQQRQLVADASHELRTPLTSLRTNIEVLARGGDIPAGERREILADATFEIDELTKIVGELVGLATDLRMEEREREDVRLDDLVLHVVDRARRRTGIAIDLAAQPTLVVGNVELIERAVSNLVDNACKWSPREAHVEVSVADGRVEVRDHGPGIAAADIPHVFERFYRSEAARSKPGSGLGLAIVRQIVEAHDGTIELDSTPGEGARIAFTLPHLPLGT